MLKLVVVLAVMICSILPSRAGVLARFETPLGTMDVELFDKDKPQTVANFIRYALSGYWTSNIVHRWDTNRTGVNNRNFVIQGGGYNLTNTARGNYDLFMIPRFSSGLQRVSFRNHLQQCVWHHLHGEGSESNQFSHFRMVFQSARQCIS